MSAEKTGVEHPVLAETSPTLTAKTADASMPAAGNATQKGKNVNRQSVQESGELDRVMRRRGYGQNWREEAPLQEVLRAQQLLKEEQSRGKTRLETNEKLLDAMKDRGIQIRLEEFKGDEARRIGKYDAGTDTIILNRNAKGEEAFLRVAMHEVTHSTEMTDAYRTFRRMAEQSFAGDASLEREIARVQQEYRQQAGQNLDREGALREITAEYMARLLQSSDRLEAIVRGNRSRAQKLLDAIRDVVRRLTHKASRDELALLRKAENTLEKALGEKDKKKEREPSGKSGQFGKSEQFGKENTGRESSREERSKKETAPRSGTEYSIEEIGDEEKAVYDYTKSFAQQVEDYKAGKIPKNDTLLIGQTPEVFRKIGMTALPMTINQRHVDYALNGTKDFDHAIGEEGLRQLPKALEHPVAILASKTKNGTSLVAMLEMRQNGKQIVVPVVIDGYGTLNWLRIDSNAVTSVYGKKDSIRQVLKDALEDEADGKAFSVYYVDKEKAARMFEGARVPMPKMPQTKPDGFVHSIGEAGSPVKAKFENVTQTQQFKRWFGDWQNEPQAASKVVNEDGTPKVVYHGTDGDFNTFRQENGAYFFSESEDYAESMAEEKGGSRVIEAYLDMKKPYEVRLSREEFTDPSAERKPIRYAKENGYDGVIFENDTARDDLAYDRFYVVFSPEQIKSATENIGTFDKGNPDIRYSIEEIGDGTNAVRIDRDILDGVPKSEWVRTVKQAFRTLFPDGIDMGFYKVGVGKRSRDEYTNSEYTKKIRNQFGNIYADKMRMVNNLDEIVQNAKDVHNELPRHPRKDRFGSFNRGTVEIRIQDRAYTAQVVTAVDQKNGETFYDIVGIEPKRKGSLPIQQSRKTGKEPTGADAFRPGDFTRDGKTASADSIRTNPQESQEKISTPKTAMELAMEEAQQKSSDGRLNALARKDGRGVAGTDTAFSDKDSSFRENVKGEMLSLEEMGEENIRRTIEELVKEFGAIERGEKPANDVRIPKRVDKDTKVRRGVRTVAESRHVDEEAMTGLLKEVADGVYSYHPEGDSKAVEHANQMLDEYGYDTAYRIFVSSMENERITKNDMLLGERLLVEAAKEKDYDRLRQITAMLAVEGTRSGQVVQAMSVLKRLGPEGQLVALQRTVDRLKKDAEKKLEKRSRGLREKNAAEIAELEGQLAEAKNAGETAAKELERIGGAIEELKKDELRLSSVPERIQKRIFRMEERVQKLAGDILDRRKAAEQVKAETQAQFEELEEILKSLERERNNLSAQKKRTEARIYNRELRIQNVAGDLLSIEKALQGLQPRLEEVQRAAENLDMTKRAMQEIEEKVRRLSGEIVLPQETIDDILSQKTQQGLDEAMARAYAEIGEQMPSTFADKWNAWRYMAMLANPTTHIRNVIGNAAFIPARTVKNLLKVPLENMLLREGDRTAAVLTGEDAALKELGTASFEENQNFLTSSGKYNPSDEIRNHTRIFETEVLETIRKINGDALEAEDVWFLKPAYVNAYAKYLKANEYESQSEQRQKQLRNAAHEWASGEAWRATYRDASAVAEAISKTSRKNIGSALLIEGMLPFKKTPVNIAKRGMEYSPIGLMKAVYEMTHGVREGKISAAMAIDHLAAGMTGSAIFMLGYFLANSGLLTGAGDDDDRVKKFLKQVGGFQEYSLQIGDWTYTLDWLAPTSLPLFSGVELWEALRDGEEISPRMLWDVLSNTWSPMVEMSMLSTISDVVQSTGYGGSGGQKIANAGAEILGDYLSQALPTIGTRVNRTIDKVSRNVYYNDKTDRNPSFVQRTLRAALNKNPGMSRLLEPKIGVWGKEIETPFAERVLEAFVSPGYYSKNSMNEADKEVMRLYGETGDHSVIPPTELAKSFAVNGETRNISYREYTQYARTTGETQYTLISQALRSSWYQGLPDEGGAISKTDVIEKIYKYARYCGKKSIEPEYTDKGLDKAAETCRRANITYIEYLKAQAGAKGENGSATKKQLVAYLNGTALNERQKQLLFEAILPNAKNPY